MTLRARGCGWGCSQQKHPVGTSSGTLRPIEWSPELTPQNPKAYARKPTVASPEIPNDERPDSLSYRPPSCPEYAKGTREFLPREGLRACPRRGCFSVGAFEFAFAPAATPFRAAFFGPQH